MEWDDINDLSLETQETPLLNKKKRVKTFKSKIN